MNPAEFSNIAAAERDLWWYRGMHRILFRLLDPIARHHQFARVLEAGCGTGYMSTTLGERYRWPITSIDLDPRGLAHPLPGFVQATVTSLPFDTQSFDALVSLDVIPHLARGDETAAFAEFSRVLQPGGFLILRTAAFDFLRSNHSKFINETQRFTLPQLRRLARDAHLEIQRATYANMFLLPVAAFKFRVWEPITRQPPASGVTPIPRWLDSLLYAPLSLEAGLFHSGLSLPIGQSAILIARKK